MSFPIPSSALTHLPMIRSSNRSLISALESHSEFNTQKSRRSGKIYFMWDFAMRTEAMFQSVLGDNVPPTEMSEEQKKAVKEDAVGRCMLLWTMIKDESGKTEMMFGEEPGKGVDLGDAVKNAADGLTNVILEGVGVESSTQPAAS